MKKPRFINLVSDSCFKYFFKSPITKYWYIDIIKNKTGIDLSNYNIIDNELNTGNITKDYRTDIMLSNGKNTVIIEMQNNYSLSSLIKARQYLFRSAGSSFEVGEKFSDDKTTTLIMFNNFYCRQDRSCSITNYSLYSKKLKHEYKDLKIYEIYLPIIHDMSYNECSKVNKKLWLFSAKSYKEMYDVVKNDENLNIVKRLEMLGMNDKFLFEYDRERVNKKLMNSIRYEGEIDGERKGEKSKQIEIAKNSLKENLSIDLISKITGLSVKQINKLKV